MHYLVALVILLITSAILISVLLYWYKYDSNSKPYTVQFLSCNICLCIKEQVMHVWAPYTTGRGGTLYNW